MKQFYIVCILLTIISKSDEAVQIPEVFNCLGQRTPYRFKSNKHDAVIEYPDCKPKKIWMMIRHGTRRPKLNYIQAMETTLRDLKYEILIQHKLGKGNLTEDCLRSLEDWSIKIDHHEEMLLTPEGEQEMVLLAERMKKRFPSILNNKYDNKTYLFRYTATKRTQASARHFTKGLFSQKDAGDIIFAPASKVDTVLRFYKHCDKWQKQVKKNPDTYKELRAFGSSVHMNRTLGNMSHKLGLSKPLSLEQLNLMYITCGFETAWNKHYLSPWCAIFDKESAQVMEYYYDLKEYWANGYGLELTYRQACMSIKNMLQHLSNDKDPKVVLFFAHSGTILKILAHLGLYKPEAHLTADQFPNDRAWRVSNIDCFASNLAFVLFGCPERDYVLAMHQEHIIRMPSCESDLCPLKNLTRHYNDSIYDCDFTDMCSMTKKDEL